MIKKVKVDQLKPGIFIHDFNCSWKGHNLLVEQTLIKDGKIIDILHDWGVKEVYIDTDRGLDVEDGTPSQRVRHETETALQQLAEKEPHAAKYLPLREEISLAKAIKTEAVGLIQRAMDNVREGKPITTEDAYPLIEKMQNSVTRNKDALVLLTRIRKKDEYTLMHSISVGALILTYCDFYKLPQNMALNLAIGALFHDIGKTLVPIGILNKPGKLDDTEYEVMKRHAEYSAKILHEAKNLPEVAYDMGLHHHERYDGNGYPHGLKGDEITFGSQLAAVADVYDAITSDRCYRDGIDRVEGLRKLYEWSEYHFNKEVAYKFIRCIGVYPIGTCVRLESNQIGVVVGTTENLVQPVVRVFYNDSKKDSVPVHDLDLSKVGDKVVGYEEPQKWNFKQLGVFNDIAAEMSLF